MIQVNRWFPCGFSQIFRWWANGGGRGLCNRGVGFLGMRQMRQALWGSGELGQN